MVGIGDESCVLSGFSADDYVSDVFVWYVRKGGALAMLCHVPYLLVVGTVGLALTIL